MIATAGTSSRDSSAQARNVCVWDTLLPPGRALVWSAACHEGGARSLSVSSRRQVVLTGGDRGDIVFHDLRRHSALCTVKDAHEQHSVVALALSPCESMFASGSSNGGIKIWQWPAPWVALSPVGPESGHGVSATGASPQLLHHLPKVHGTKTDMWFNAAAGGGMMRQQGVTALEWTERGLFSSGADGSLKLLAGGKASV